MPDNISRRRFMRQASVSAVAAGAVAAGGLSVFTGAGSAGAAELPSVPEASDLEGSGVIAHVTDAKKGEISILVGTREIKYTNRAMAQQLLKAAQ